MIDLSKLTPAPWRAYRYMQPASDNKYALLAPDGNTYCDSKADIEFCALARAACDVQMRRRWYAGRCRNEPNRDRFFVWNEDDDSPAVSMLLCQDKAVWLDQFTALVEAEAWHVANVEKP